MSETEQNFASHRVFVPLFHGVVFSLLFLNLVYRTVVLFRHPGWASAADLLVAIALGLLTYYVRLFPLGVQNRVIRLEERLRLERLLSEDLRPRIAELSASQLIGLRFASDAELPSLARWVLDGNVRSREAIKQKIADWRADHMRI
jgi:hypothetical protein